MSKPTRPRRPLIEAIEPRLLFSATADIAVFDDGSHYVDALTHAANNLDLTQVYPDLMAQPPLSSASGTDADAADTPIALAADTAPEVATHSLVFVDTHVANYEALVQDILNNPDNKNVEIIYLNANQDGIAQISQTLSLFSNVTSIHLISHSVPGELQLGNSVLSETTIAQFKNQLEGWQQALSSDADILIYGCDLAATRAGTHLLEQLNQFTGADIAASTNLTGNAANADWVLEKNLGHIDTAALINPHQSLSWSGVLADVTYINTGAGGSNYALIPGDFAGQSFQYTSGVTIDRFSVEINKTAGAATQNLSLEIRDGYNGTIIGSATVSSSTLSNGTQWVNFDFPETALTAYQVYWVRLSTSGSDHLIAATYHNTDVFNSGTFFNNAGGANWDLSFAVTNVASSNAAPSVSITPTTYSATEQIAMNLHGTGISVADTDGDALSVTIAAAVNNSQLTASTGSTGVSITSGNGTKSLVVNGTPAQLNDFFNGNNGATLTYRIAANTPTASTSLTITASDGVLSANDTAIINITAVNDAPVNTVPGTQNISEDTPLVFSAGNGNQISIADADAATSTVQTSISVNHGVLSLAGITGLSFTSGDGSNDASMIFTGTLIDINNALASLTYNSTANYNGADSFTIITNDLGNTGSGGALSDTDTIAINLAAANDAPTIAQPIPNQNAPKNVAFNFSLAANTFSDVDTGTTLSYSAQLSGGGALPAWLNFNPTTRTFSGTPLNGDVGTVNIDVTASDGSGGSVTDSFAIITSANLDTEYINTHANGLELSVSNSHQVGQSFTFNSGTGSYIVNEISLFTVANGAAPQTVTVELLDAWSGAVLGSTSVASTDLSSANKEWYSFDFGNITLTDNITYYIKVSSTGTDDAIKLGYWGDVTSGNVIVDGVDDLSKDLAFKLSYENGSNVAPALDNPIADKAINTDAAFNFVMPGTTFSDADPFDSLSYRANLVGQSGLGWLTFDSATLQFGGTPHVSQIGTWQVEVIATDNQGASTSEFFDVVVANANTVPTLIPDQTVLEGSAYNFQFTAFNNANGHALTYTATQADGSPLPVWFNFDGATRTFYGMADDGDVNVKTIKVTATDPFGGSVSDSFTLTVNNLQEAPFVINPIADQTATGYIPFSVSFNANLAADPDIGDSLTYSTQLSGGGALPAWLTYNAATRTFSGTPTNADAGTLSIDVIATDSSNNTVTDSFDLVIAAGNTPPINTVPGAQVINEDMPLVFSAGNGNALQIADADAGSASLQVTLSVSNGGLTLASTTGLAFSAGDGANDASLVFTGTLANINAALATLTYNPNANYFGTDTLNIATDDLGNTGVGGAKNDADSVSITILSVNDAPTIANAIPDQNATEDAAFNFQFASNTFNDLDAGDTLTYATQLNGGGALPAWLSFDAITRTFSGTPTNTDVGTLTIDVTANDGHSGTVTDTFVLVIANTNDTPTIANAIPNQNAIEDTAFNFQFAANTFNDLDAGDTLTYTTQLNGGGALPAWLNFNAATRTFSGTPTNADVGTLTIDVIANDGNGGIITDTFVLVIANTNDAPTIANAIPDQNAIEDTVFNFQFAANTFNDLDAGDTLTYTTQLNGGGALPAWLNFNAATRTFSGTPTNTDVGTLTIDVIANDGNGGIITDTFALIIANTNDTPTIANAIPDQNATEDTAFNFQFASNTFNDLDAGDTLTYTTQLNGGGALPAWLNFNASTRTFSGTPTHTDAGTITIDVTASDGNGGIITDTFLIRVSAINQAPTTSGIATINTLENSAGDSIDLFAAFADREDQDSQLTYSIVSNTNSTLVTQTTIDAQTGKLQLHYGVNQFGASQITLRATDTQGASVDASFTVNVAFVNHAPTSSGIKNIEVVAGSIPSALDLAAIFSDIEDGKNLTYSVLSNSNPALLQSLQLNQQNHTASIHYNPSTLGETTITLRATDTNGGVVDSVFKVTVIAPQITVPVPPTNNGSNTDPQMPDSTPTNGGSAPSTSLPGTSVTPPSSDAEQNTPTADNALNHNLIGHSDQSDAQNIANTSHSNEPTNDNFDHNRYDRIIQQETLTKRTNDPINNHTLLSSLILPGEGFSTADAEEFSARVRKIHQEMENVIIEEQQHKVLLSGLTLSLTTGIVIWSLRASSLLLTLMSMLPLWRGIDPLPILEEVEKRKKDIEQQRKDKQAEDKNAKEVGYLFDNTNTKNPKE